MDDTPSPPRPAAPTGRDRAARLERQAQALRDNLRRRKQQARARAGRPATEAPRDDDAPPS